MERGDHSEIFESGENIVNSDPERRRIEAVFELPQAKLLRGEVTTKMNEEYFNDSEKIKGDLISYALAMSLDSPLELNCSKKAMTQTVQCKNGEVLLFSNYLSRAGVALGMKPTVREARGISSGILNFLLEKYFDKKNLPKMNLVYFTDEAKVKADLKAFALINRLENAQYLHCGNKVLESKVKCQNGESIQFQAYLLRVAKAFGLASNKKEARTVGSKILDFLLEKYWDKKIISRMDEVYFQDSSKVKADLNNYALVANLEDSQKLYCGREILKCSIICQNGEPIQFQTYLSRAGVIFGIASNKREAHSISPIILDFLLEKYCGKKNYSKMDEPYFKNVGKVKVDLTSYALALGVDSPFKLKCNKYDLAQSIKCQNGQTISFRKYLSNAGVALNFAKNKRDVHSKFRLILDHLLKTYFLSDLNDFPLESSTNSSFYGTRKEVIAALGLSYRAVEALERTQHTLLKPKTISRKINDLKLRGFKDPLKMIDYLPSLLNYSIENIDEKIEIFRRLIKQYELAMDPLVELEKHPNWLSFSLERFKTILNIAAENSNSRLEINGKKIATMFSYNLECLILAAAKCNGEGLRKLVQKAHELNKRGLSQQEKKNLIQALPNDNSYKQQYFKIYPPKAA